MKTELYKELIDLIEKERLVRGIEKRAMAKSMGITPLTYWRKETNKFEKTTGNTYFFTLDNIVRAFLFLEIDLNLTIKDKIFNLN